MVIPLDQLGYLGIEAAYVFIQQIVDVVAAELGERLGDLGLFRDEDILPERAVFELDFCLHRIIGIDVVAAMDEKIRLQTAHLVVNPHATPLWIDAPPLASGIPAPDKGDVAALGWCRAEMAQGGSDQDFGASEVLENHAIEDLLPSWQIGQRDACRKVADGKRGWALHPSSIGKGVCSGIFHQHAAWFVGTTPDDGRVVGHVTAGYAIWDARTCTVRRHECWSGALRPRTTLPGASGEDARTGQSHGR